MQIFCKKKKFFFQKVQNICSKRSFFFDLSDHKIVGGCSTLLARSKENSGYVSAISRRDTKKRCGAGRASILLRDRYGRGIGDGRG